MAKIAYITAGGAGMFCGSCMRDNTLAAQFKKLGEDIVLIPTYTPIRTDEADVSLDQVFYGGINVYLQEKWGLFRFLPRFLDRWLDRPGLIRKVSSGNIEIDAKQLGEMTVSMLRGEKGRQRKEVRRLVDFLKEHITPTVIDFSNALITGCIPVVKRELKSTVIVTLQGDDLFLNDLKEPYKSQAFAEIRRICRDVDAFIAFSRYYADYMGELFEIPAHKFHIVPLGIDFHDFVQHDSSNVSNKSEHRTIGYLARICPAKGFNVMVDAFLELRRLPGMGDVRFRAAGWLGESDRAFFESQKAKIKSAGAEEHFEYQGVVDREEKVRFLKGLDVFSVPTHYREPKGLYALEALASGLPVVQPAHGAFPELLEGIPGASLFTPERPASLAGALQEILTMPIHNRRSLGQQGSEEVQRRHSAERMAQATLDVYRQHNRIP